MPLYRTTSDHSDYQKRVVLLDATLKVLDGEDHAFYAQYNKSDSIKNVVLFYENDEVLGCGASKLFEGKTVEIKRIFVLPEHRGKGISQQILRELENWAQESEFSCCILETGKMQVDAIGLYQKAGYEVIPNYGQYVGVLNSVCMQKAINK